MTKWTSNKDSPQTPLIQIGSGAAIPLRDGVEYRETPKPKVDINFVFDTTGSMSDKIDGLVASMVDLVRELASLALDWRVTTVPFGDLSVPRDRVVTDQPFVTTREAAENQLRTMPRFSGGGNIGESSLEAMDAALKKAYRKDAIKVLVLITDEPALEGHIFNAFTIGKQLRKAEVICFVASPDLPYFKKWAEDCGGAWVPIGQTMDTKHVRELLRGLVKQVAVIAFDVYQLAGGSVAEYLALPSRPHHST